MILITGANGFLGSALLEHLTKNYENICSAGVVRKNSQSCLGNKNLIVVPDYTDHQRWAEVLKDVSVVIHCAARAHILNEKIDKNKQLEEYRKSNVENTITIANQAAISGVSRFIFVSSIAVNGDSTSKSRKFKFDDAPNPQNFYGQSKMEAEIELRKIAQETDLEVVIIRPPLIYGPNGKGNFEVMQRWMSYGIPLPFGSIPNLRSFVALENLINLLEICIEHPAASNRTFLVSDCEDISTTKLLRRLSVAMNKSIYLIPIYIGWLQFGFKIFGQKKVAKKLLCSLQIDVAETQLILSWKPIISMEKALKTLYDRVS